MLMNFFLTIAAILTGLYILGCAVVYLIQERLIFKPQKLSLNHHFNFKNEYKEMFIEAADGSKINGLLFNVKEPIGLVFYMHGNIGSLNSWGEVPANYINLGYDVFIYDYRSYGKSEGKIRSQKQLFDDNQRVYDSIKTQYAEKDIVILGHSLGTAMAAKLAVDNPVGKLILITPYYSMSGLVKRLHPYLPVFILKYKLATWKYLKNCKMPVVIFHGDKDDLVDYNDSLKLQKFFKTGDKLITMKGQGHYRINDSQDYRAKLSREL